MVSQDDAAGSPTETTATPPEQTADAAAEVIAESIVEVIVESIEASSLVEKRSRRGVPRNASQVPTRSKKLDRTLKELESAFTDWESLSCAKARAAAEHAASEEERLKASLNKEAQATEDEFRKKTRKLLGQLREQLSELND